jgi:hypothetical protein
MKIPTVPQMQLSLPSTFIETQEKGLQHYIDDNVNKELLLQYPLYHLSLYMDDLSTLTYNGFIDKVINSWLENIDSVTDLQIQWPEMEKALGLLNIEYGPIAAQRTEELRAYFLKINDVVKLINAGSKNILLEWVEKGAEYVSRNPKDVLNSQIEQVRMIIMRDKVSHLVHISTIFRKIFALINNIGLEFDIVNAIYALCAAFLAKVLGTLMTVVQSVDEKTVEDLYEKFRVDVETLIQQGKILGREKNEAIWSAIKKKWLV